MGGNGAALEFLEEELVNYRNGGSCDELINNICRSINAAYSDWSKCKNLVSVIKEVLLGTEFQHLQSPLAESTVDVYQNLGFIKWNPSSKKLHCPVVWIKAAAQHLDSEIKKIVDVSLCYKNLEDPEMTWKCWENFVAQFWCFKSSLVNGLISWQSLHAGAMFKSKTTEIVLAKKLTLVKAVQWGKTSSQKLDISEEIQTATGKVKPGEGNHHILSLSNNPAGDSFCYLTLPASDSAVTFAISCKNVNVTRTAAQYLAEYEKAACKEDFFMEYSTGDYTIKPQDLPNCCCGLVYKENFKDYFGPFSGRAFLIANLVLPNMNTSTWDQLRSVDGIGEALANTIVNLRADGVTFQSAADAIEKVPGLGMKKAKLFAYD